MKTLIILCLILTLGGCANGPSTPNPITSNSLYEGELVFDATLKTFLELKGLCANRTLPPKCRIYVKQAQATIVKIYAADKAARSFAKNNPTLDATNAVQAFTGLVSQFKGTVDSLSKTGG